MRLEINMHPLDRMARSLLAIGLVYYGFIDSSWVSSPMLASLLGIIGVVNLVFSMSGFCPLYRLAGLNFYQPEKVKK